jgi:sugar/nucleoside kinase (ribokinase family)
MAEVVSLGIHILDVLGRPVTRIPPRQDVDLLEEIRLTVAGTAAGASVDLAKLGANVLAMGAIGEDAAGNFIVDTMQRYGVDTSALARKSGVQTSATMLPIRPNGERPALHVLGANATLDLIAIDRPDLLDVIAPALPYVDYFMPGLDEARMICGLQDRREVIRFFLDRGVRHTIFKMGAEGSSIAYRGGVGEIVETRVPAFATTVVDSTGCGDAYCAGFIVGLRRGWDLIECARFGSAAAALVITGLGSDAGIVDFAHTMQFMRSADTLPMTE